jgi:uracil-DNA glycosylase
LSERRRPSACAGCPLNPATPGHDSVTCGGFVPPEGRDVVTRKPARLEDSRLLVVGIAPGEEEESKGRPFVGPSGRKLDHTLRWAASEYGLDSLPVYYLNVVNCRTKQLGYKGAAVNRDPKAVEVRQCARRYLWPILARWRGPVLVLSQFTWNWVTFYTPRRKRTDPATVELAGSPLEALQGSKSGKLADGLFGSFGLGMGHRAKVSPKLYEEMVKRHEESK